MTSERLTSKSYWTQEKATRLRDTLLAAQQVIPKAEEVSALEEQLAHELERGYFSPETDELLRERFARYLHVRSALGDILQQARQQLPIFRRHLRGEELKSFLGGWLAGCILMRSSRYLLNRYEEQAQVRAILNQADPRRGVPPRMFDEIRNSSTSPRNLFRFFWALEMAEAHREDIAALAADPEFAPLLQLLEEEQPFLEKQKHRHADAFARAQIARAKRRPGRYLRALNWELFEHSGRVIAECRNPFHRKRVRRPILRKLQQQLQPGDILVTRHDDALSNLFLPGFWPHAALCVGRPEQRAALGVHFSTEQEEQAGASIAFLEARKDGVRIRHLADTLSVDSFVVIRPRGLRNEERAELLRRARTHVGKLYDFEFDFTRSDRLVCTEVVYRSMDSVGEVHFDCIKTAGRHTLPAEELLRQCLQQHELFEVLTLFGVSGNHWLEGPDAREALEQSLSSKTGAGLSSPAS